MRPASPDDAPLVMALTLAAYEEYRGVLVPESGVFHETLEEVRGLLEGRAGATLVPGARNPALASSGAVIAQIGGIAVGCARWSVQMKEAPPDTDRPGREATPSPAPSTAFLYVGRVAVLPGYRGQGVASALVAWCERLAVDRRLAEARLGVRLGLERNERLYRRLGYEPTGELEEREGYGPIAQWMARRLPDAADAAAGAADGSRSGFAQDRRPLRGRLPGGTM
ncbi:MAG: GNAT family N-acetyltransferase [Candidatus Limnocylindrales bacterium]